jgi:hypothetical protein
VQKKRRKYVAQQDSDEEERIESEDINQFRVISHPPRSTIDTMCENIKNADFFDLKSIEFNNLSREEQNKIEDSVYTMMAEFKNTPLELDNTMPRELYEIIENKWHYCLKMEKEIRESTLAQVMPNLSRGQITKANKKHAGKFTPKYRAFSILQNKIEDVVNTSTKIWKLIYGLTTVKDGEEDPLKEQHTEKGEKAKPSEREKVEEKIEEKGEEKEVDEEIEKGEEEEPQKQDEMAIAK